MRVIVTGGRWLCRSLEALPVRRLPSVPLLLVPGLVLSLLLLVWRSQVSGDQLNMLAWGWLLTHGQWVHIGMTPPLAERLPAVPWPYLSVCRCFCGPIIGLWRC